MSRKQVTILVVSSLFAIQLYLSKPARAQTTYEWSMVAQATPDECFEGNVNAPGGITAAQVTANNNSFNSAYPSGLSAAQIASCISAGYLPKVNQSYVWGLTEDSTGDLWFGTASNVLCDVLNSYYGSVPAPYENSDYVCDAQQNPEEDYKPPRFFMYNPGTNTLTDETLKVAYAATLDKTGTLAKYLAGTLGLRSAGYDNGIVFMGGLYINSTTTPTTLDVVLYAFNASTQAFLGYYVFDGTNGKPWYNDIRQWHVINGSLFAGVANGTTGGGSLIRWLGTPAAPFAGSGGGAPFEEDGETNAQIAYFTAHTDGHIYATTWGDGGAGQAGMELYMSPPLNASTGLTTNDANNWTPVWNLNQYEVEPSAQWAGGAIASYGGYLYFGTMQVPATSVLNFYSYYSSLSIPNPPPSTGPLSEATVFLSTLRPDTIFRTAGYDPTLQPTPSMQLLYGSQYLEQFNTTTETWNLVPNGMGQAPLYGAAGFGNVFNNYTWSMAVFQNQLYVGTMDFSYLLNGTATASSVSSPIITAMQTLASYYYGADLWMFPDSSTAATLVNGGGMGNDTTYGIRNMLADNNNLWLGMANPMNLRTDVNDNPGGWKLIQFPTQNGAPMITWYNPVAITYGTPLTATQLNATATVDGTYTYTPPLGTVLKAGANQTLSLVFVPFDSGNQYGASVKLTVNPEPLTVTAANVSVTYGAPFPTTFIGTITGLVNNDNITATYATTATSTSPAGSYPITPTVAAGQTNLTSYNVTTVNGTLTVSQAGTTSAVSATASSVLLKSSVTFTANVASATTGTPTGNVTFMDGSTSLGTVALASGSAQLPISTLAAGTHSITVVYGGDGNFVGSTSTAYTETVEDFQFNTGSSSVMSATVMPGGLATFSFLMSPSYGNYFPAAVTLSLTGLPAGATYTINPSTITAGSGPTNVVVTVQTASTYSMLRGLPTGLTLAILFLPIVGLTRLRRRMRGIALLAFVMIAVGLGINGCKGSSSGYFSGQTQTSTLTVTGTSGSLQHSVTLNLTVQ